MPRHSLAADESADDVLEWEDGWGTVWHRLRGYTSGEVLIGAP